MRIRRLLGSCSMSGHLSSVASASIERCRTSDKKDNEATTKVIQAADERSEAFGFLEFRIYRAAAVGKRTMADGLPKSAMRSLHLRLRAPAPSSRLVYDASGAVGFVVFCGVGAQGEVIELRWRFFSLHEKSHRLRDLESSDDGAGIRASPGHVEGLKLELPALEFQLRFFELRPKPQSAHYLSERAFRILAAVSVVLAVRGGAQGETRTPD